MDNPSRKVGSDYSAHIHVLNQRLQRQGNLREVVSDFREFGVRPSLLRSDAPRIDSVAAARCAEPHVLRQFRVLDFKIPITKSLSKRAKSIYCSAVKSVAW